MGKHSHIHFYYLLQGDGLVFFKFNFCFLTFCLCHRIPCCCENAQQKTHLNTKQTSSRTGNTTKYRMLGTTYNSWFCICWFISDWESKWYLVHMGNTHQSCFPSIVFVVTIVTKHNWMLRLVSLYFGSNFKIQRQSD